MTIDVGKRWSTQTVSIWELDSTRLIARRFRILSVRSANRDVWSAAWLPVTKGMRGWSPRMATVFVGGRCSEPGGKARRSRPLSRSRLEGRFPVSSGLSAGSTGVSSHGSPADRASREALLPGLALTQGRSAEAMARARASFTAWADPQTRAEGSAGGRECSPLVRIAQALWASWLVRATAARLSCTRAVSGAKPCRRPGACFSGNGTSARAPCRNRGRPS